MEQADSFVDIRGLAWKARQYRWLIALPIVMSLCVAFLYLKTGTRIYESHVMLSVADGPKISGTLQSIVNPDRPVDSPRDRITILDNRVHQRGFLVTLAGRLGIAADPAARAAARKQAEAFPGVSAEEILLRSTTVRLGRKISVIPGTGPLVNISAVDPDPRQAATLATAAAALLVEQARQTTLDRAQARGAFSSDQMAIYQERLQRSEDALRAYQETLIGRNINASVINDGNLDIARNLIRMNSEEMEQIRSRIQSARRAWAIEAGTEAVMPDLSSASAVSLEARLAQLEVDFVLAQLGADRSAAAAAALMNRISAMRQDLYNEYESLAQRELGAYSEGARLAAIGAILDRSVLRTLRAKGERVSSLVRIFSASVQSSPRSQLELERLRNAVETNRQLLATLQKEMTSSRLSEALEVSELGMRIEVVESAQIPVSPIHPNRSRTLGIALLIGPLIGVGLVFAIEQFGGVVRTVEQVEKEIGATVVGTLPRVEEWSRPGGFVKNNWAALSILFVLLFTGAYYTIHFASQSRERTPVTSPTSPP